MDAQLSHIYVEAGLVHRAWTQLTEDRSFRVTHTGAELGLYPGLLCSSPWALFPKTYLWGLGTTRKPVLCGGRLGGGVLPLLHTSKPSV